jgi:hypothetical protein
MGFKKAAKKQQKLKMGIQGASGSGKTYSSLLLASGISNNIAVLDSEKGSASLYSDHFDFDTMELKPPYTPESYIQGIKDAEEAGYDVLIIDSISHEWKGKGGCLDIVNKIGGNSYIAWGKVTPRHDLFIDTILSSPMHIICTLRAKPHYETGKNSNGKMTIEKVGTAPVQREDTDFELTTILALNKNHVASSDKDRTHLFEGKDCIITKETGEMLMDWLNSGEEVEKLVKKPPLRDTRPHNTIGNRPVKTVFNYNNARDEIKKLATKVHLNIGDDKLNYFKVLFKQKNKPYTEEKYLEDKYYIEDLIKKVDAKKEQERQEKVSKGPEIDSDGKEPDLEFNADSEQKNEALPPGVE